MDDTCFRLLCFVISSGNARLHERGTRDWSGRDRFTIAGGGTGIVAWQSNTSRAGGLPAQGAVANGIDIGSIRGPDLVRLVALVLGILDNVIIRGSDEFRVFRPLGGDSDPA